MKLGRSWLTEPREKSYKLCYKNVQPPYTNPTNPYIRKLAMQTRSKLDWIKRCHCQKRDPTRIWIKSLQNPCRWRWCPFRPMVRYRMWLQCYGPRPPWTFFQRSFQFLQSQVQPEDCSSTCRSAGTLDLIWYSRSFSHTFNQISKIEYIHSCNFIHRDIKPTHPLALDLMQGVHVQVARSSRGSTWMVDYEPHPWHLSPSDCHPICNGDQ
jgi:hypothetical protein